MLNVKMLVAVALFVGVGYAAAGQQASEAEKEQAKRDQLRIAVQEICPVSGRKLGEHGAPLKVKIGEETVFLCCKGCQHKKVDQKHWATIHANFARAQAQCPVRDKALPKSPKWALAEGQIVYVCCPGCIKKIEADPKTYLQKVDELYMASLKAKQRAR